MVDSPKHMVTLFLTKNITLQPYNTQKDFTFSSAYPAKDNLW